MASVLFIAIFILIICSAMFSCSDIVYATVNQLRLKKDIANGSKSAKIALNFAENYDSTITTILFSNNLVNIAASSLTIVLANMLTNHNNIAQTISTIILVFVLVIFGEIIPKVIGRVFSYRLSKFLAYPIRVLKIIFFPIVFITSNLGKLVAKIFIRENNIDDVISDEELEQIVESIEEEGVIDEDKSELLKSVIDFTDTEAYEIMTPRVDMFAVDINTDLKKLLKEDRTFTHSRVPVYKDNIDNVVGILQTKKLLRDVLAKKQPSLSTLLTPVMFVPHSMGISEILEQMKKTKNHIAIIKDEFGGTEGLITMEDILEELVGNMFDEMDKVTDEYKKVGRNEYTIDANMNINDFFDLINEEDRAEGDYTTVGGWVIDQLGRFAVVGDKFTANNIRVEVLDATDFTVERIFIHVIKRRNKNS